MPRQQANSLSARPTEVDGSLVAGVRELGQQVEILRIVLDEIREDISWLARNGLRIEGDCSEGVLRVLQETAHRLSASFDAVGFEQVDLVIEAINQVREQMMSHSDSTDPSVEQTEQPALPNGSQPKTVVPTGVASPLASTSEAKSGKQRHLF